MTRLCTLSPSRPASGVVVDRDRHRQGRRIDRAAPGSASSTPTSHSVSATVASSQAGDGDDVAGFGALHRHARQAAEGQQLGDAGASRRPCRRAFSALMWRLVVMDARFDAAGQDAAEIIVGLQRRHQHLEGMLVARQSPAAWARGTSSTMRSNSGIEILVLVLQFLHRPAVAARGVEIVEVQAGRHWPPAPGTDRKCFPVFLSAGRRSGRSC